MVATADDILNFWLDEIGPEHWYNPGPTLDDDIRTRFEAAWHEALDGSYGLWLTYPAGTLAYIILTDQFPRNMFRDEDRAFASDRPSRAAAKMAISKNWDMRIDEPARQFFYLPLMHSENLIDQDRAVRLFCNRMPETGADNLLHAKAHRDVIRRFGRFPYRNDALGRNSTKVESAYLQEGGYASTMRSMTESETAA